MKFLFLLNFLVGFLGASIGAFTMQKTMKVPTVYEYKTVEIINDTVEIIKTVHTPVKVSKDTFETPKNTSWYHPATDSTIGEALVWKDNNTLMYFTSDGKMKYWLSSNPQLVYTVHYDGGKIFMYEWVIGNGKSFTVLVNDDQYIMKTPYSKDCYNSFTFNYEGDLIEDGNNILTRKIYPMISESERLW